MSPGSGAVMLTLDESDFAEQAIEHAQKLAKSLGTGIVVLEVLPERRGPAPFSIEGARASEHRHASAYLRSVKARLERAGVSDVDVLKVEGASAGDAIVESARSLGCTAVVMATHARGGLSRLLRGSVAGHVDRKLSEIEVVLIEPNVA